LRYPLICVLEANFVSLFKGEAEEDFPMGVKKVARERSTYRLNISIYCQQSQFYHR